MVCQDKHTTFRDSGCYLLKTMSTNSAAINSLPRPRSIADIWLKHRVSALSHLQGRCWIERQLELRVRQLKRTELAWRVGSAQCLRSPQKSQIFGGPERSNRTAKPIVRPKGDKNSLERSKEYRRYLTKTSRSALSCQLGKCWIERQLLSILMSIIDNYFFLKQKYARYACYKNK